MAQLMKAKNAEISLCLAGVLYRVQSRGKEPISQYSFFHRTDKIGYLSTIVFI